MKKLLGGAVLLFGIACSGLVVGQEQNWLPPGSDTRPARPIPEWVLGGQLDGDALIGRLLFHSPSLLGERAVRMRISCASCHPSGHLNKRFFIPGVSSKPGFVDLTNQFWFDGGEDGKFNPKRIPSLHNARNKPKFGTGPQFDSLEDFSRHVIVDEFGGPEPDPYILKALATYIRQLTRPQTTDAAPLPRPISFQNYIDLAEKSDGRLDLVASLLIEEAGRRQRHERNLIYRKVAVELKRLRTGNPSEADKNNLFTNLRDLSKQIP